MCILKYKKKLVGLLLQKKKVLRKRVFSLFLKEDNYLVCLSWCIFKYKVFHLCCVNLLFLRLSYIFWPSFLKIHLYFAIEVMFRKKIKKTQGYVFL